MPDLSQLRTFVAVVQEGHLTRAAERLHMSQPTASNHIRALEREFEVQLFHRHTRGLEATAAGRRLADVAARILGDSAELVSLARSLQGKPSGRLLIGTIEDRDVLAQLPVLTQWVRERYPLVELGFESRNSLAIRQGIATGELDAGFFVAAAVPTDMVGFEVKRLEFVVAGPSSWAERLGCADRAALAAMPWVATPPGTSNAELAQRLFAPLGLQARETAVVSNDTLLRAMVRGGIGIGFILRELAEKGVGDGSFTIVPGTWSTTGLQFGYARVRQTDPLLELLSTGLREVLSSTPHE